MKGKQYLCMVQLYMEDGKLCVDYAHNAADEFAERIALHNVRRFINERIDEVDKEVIKKIEEEIEL